MKILLAVDGSPYTKRLLEYLATHEQFLDGHQEYVAMHVVTPIPARAAASLDRETLQSYYDDEADKVFKPLRSFFKKHGIHAQFIAKTGNAAAVISKTATSGKFDLLAMGSRGHGSIGSLLLGSVAVKVINGCETPVLLIR